jgi:hypothetical protein
MTVRVELAPPLIPIINDNANSTVAIGQFITLDAYYSPNQLQQIDTLSWDYYSGDGLANNDASGWEVEAHWQIPGVKNVTLTATSKTGEIAQTSHTITVIDIVDPVARITGSGLPVSNGWRVNIDESISFNCDSSSDDYTELTCAWTYDGTPYGQNNSILLSWNDIGTHDIGLIVSDSAGNTNSATTSVIVLDTTLPVLEQSSLEGFASSGIVGEKLTFSVSATDSYDDMTNLRYHWDLQPSRDTDNNGNPRDDADLTGYQTSITFNTVGRNEVVLTVFDQSNNSDSHAFAVNVIAAPIQDGITPILFLVLFIVAITSAVAILGHRRWQSSIATDLLLGRGLSEAEVIVHLATIRQNKALPLFASATQLAGLDAGEVQSRTDVETAQKEAELQQIYGAENSADLGFARNSAFAHAPEMSAGSLTSANEAAALLQEESSSQSALQPVQSEAPVATVKSGGIALPEGVTSTPPVVIEQQIIEQQIVEQQVVEQQVIAVAKEMKCVCESCAAGFEITLPAGVPQAIVACPSCQVDNLISA